MHCALDMSRSFFFKGLTKDPGEVWGVIRETIVWLKFYYCVFRTVGSMVLYMAAVYRESIVLLNTVYVFQNVLVHLQGWICDALQAESLIYHG